LVVRYTSHLRQINQFPPNMSSSFFLAVRKPGIFNIVFKRLPAEAKHILPAILVPWVILEMARPNKVIPFNFI